MDMCEEEEGYIERFGLGRTADVVGRIPATAVLVQPAIVAPAPPAKKHKGKKKKKQQKGIITVKLI